MTTSKTPSVDGFVESGFEPVRDGFVENFTLRGELGGACCIYHNGEKVVDLWGGVRDRRSGEPWRADTMVVVHSATKGLAAMVIALLHSRGLLDYDERVSSYWPEFAEAGKERITVRQLLAHQAHSRSATPLRSARRAPAARGGSCRGATRYRLKADDLVALRR